MTAARLRTVFLVDAVYSLITGVVFLAGTWDGLYDAIELPQPKPGISTQIAGTLLIGVAYLLWVGRRTPAMMLPLARASAGMNALSVIIVFAWLIHGGLGIETAGEVILGALAVFMTVLFALFTAASLRPATWQDAAP